MELARVASRRLHMAVPINTRLCLRCAEKSLANLFAGFYNSLTDPISEPEDQ